MKNKLGYAVIISSMMLSMPAASLNLVHAEETQTQQQLQNAVEASYTDAINEVKIPKYDENGNKVDQGVTEYLKAKLNTNNLKAEKDDTNKTLKFDIQLKDVNLTSDYVNGKSAPGVSYFNMVNFFTNVKQVRQLLEKNDGYTAIDSKGNEVTLAYVKELEGLLQQINDFDPTTNLQYDWDSAYDTDAFKNETTRGGTDVIATSKEGNVSFKFHIDSHGWWGYDLGTHDSFTGLVMGQDAETAQEEQHEQTMKYANFFVITMKSDDHGTWYMLNDTDLQNPMIYVSKDGTKAFMIDVDFYGAHVINQKIKAVIGDKCEELKIFCTHNHGDHVNNLATIGQDDDLRKITTIVWPENEPHTVLSENDTTVKDMVGKDLISDIAWNKVETVADKDVIKAGGSTFQFLEIPNEHTPGGGQLADLTHSVIYSGDTLGAQVHLGGTTVQYQNLDNWIAGAKKAAAYVEKNDIKYNIGAHTPYLNNPNYAKWMATALEYGKENTAEPTGNTPSMNLVIAENGIVTNGTDRYGEIMSDGLTDRGELAIASVNVLRFKSEDSKEETKTEDNTKKEETKTEDNKTTETKTDTAQTTNQNTNAASGTTSAPAAQETNQQTSTAAASTDTTASAVSVKLGKVSTSTAVAKDSKSVKISWKTVKNAKRYQVAYKKNGKWTYKQTTKTNYTVKGKKNQLLAVKVRALNGDVKGNWSKTSYRYLNTVKLSLTKDKKKVTAQVSKVNGTGYQLSYTKNKNFKNAKLKTVKGSKKVTLKLKGTYYVKARGYKTSKGHTYTGRYTTTLKLTVK